MQILLSTFGDMRSGQIIRQEQNEQCMYDVTLRWANATTDAVENQLVLHILSVCVYP